MASFKERKSDPTEIMQLEGFTVDYCDSQPGTFYWLFIMLCFFRKCLATRRFFKIITFCLIYCTLQYLLVSIWW